MAIFDLRKRRPARQLRFRRPEFQAKLARARRYERQTIVVPESWGSRFLSGLGLRSAWRRGIAILFLILLFYFLTLSRVFLVRQVSVLGEGISPAEVEDVLQSLEKQRRYLVPRNHILLLSKRQLLLALQDELPEVRQITRFKRGFPNQLALAVEKRKPLYVWQSGESYYLLDQDGVVFQKVLTYEPSSFAEVLLADQTQAPVQVGQALPIGKPLQFVEKVKNQWPREIPQTTFASFVLLGSLSPDITVKTGLGFQVYFDLDRSVEAQLRNLNLLLAQEIKPETYSGLSYIDLRLPNIAYYCYLDAPCAPENATSTLPKL